MDLHQVGTRADPNAGGCHPYHEHGQCQSRHWNTASPSMDRSHGYWTATRYTTGTGNELWNGEGRALYTTRKASIQEPGTLSRYFGHTQGHAGNHPNWSTRPRTRHCKVRVARHFTDWYATQLGFQPRTQVLTPSTGLAYCTWNDLSQANGFQLLSRKWDRRLGYSGSARYHQQG